jgi:hypothetical protein
MTKKQDSPPKDSKVVNDESIAEILRILDGLVAIPSIDELQKYDKSLSDHIERQMKMALSGQEVKDWKDSPESGDFMKIASNVFDAFEGIVDQLDRARQLRDQIIEMFEKDEPISSFAQLPPLNGIELVVLIGGIDKRTADKAAKMANAMMSERGRQGAESRHSKNKALKEEAIQFWRSSGMSKNNAAKYFSEFNLDDSAREPILNYDTVRSWLQGAS